MGLVHRTKRRQKLSHHPAAPCGNLGRGPSIDSDDHGRSLADGARASRHDLVLQMHVALNLAFLIPGEMGGLEVYARRLSEALSHRDDVEVTLLLGRQAAREREWADLARVLVLPIDARRRVEWVLADQIHVPRAAARVESDVVHSLASTGPIGGRVPRVVTVHDLHYRVQPDAHFGLRGLGMRMLVPAAARRSRRVIVPSHATRQDVVRHLNVPAERVDVVPEAVGRPAVAPARSRDQVRANLRAGDRRLLLTVSAKRPHKNLIRLLGALARLANGDRPLLVMPGYPTPHEDELRARAAELGIGGDVRFLGWIPDQELEDLYRAADAFVFPSLHEGFGLPVLEAMARGIPVVTSSRTSLAEVAGDAALLFDAEDEASIARAIERVLRDPELAQRLAAAGHAQAARFTWRATAAGTVAAYRRALGISR
jgi:glycosyltransferase involved in cell wall biosynthesis